MRSSHERSDGRGYPDGLAGQSILIGARIVFVADAFCTMTEKRAYAGARSIQSTCEELRSCGGTQFDPAAVAAFLEVLDRRTSADAADSTRKTRDADLATVVPDTA